VTYPVLQIIPLGACLLGAVVWDVRARRIPNGVIGVAAGLGLFAQFWDGGVLSVMGGVLAAALTVAMLFSFWTKGGIGGGDVKLAGAVAIWIGLRALPWFALSTALAGGVTALVCLALSKTAARKEIQANLTLTVLQQQIPTVETAGVGRVSVPYAIAIAAGVVATWYGPRLF